MPLLLAIPLAVIIALAVFAVLFPLSLLQRFRVGTARRQARGWLLLINLVSAAVSSVLFVVFTLIAAAFWPGAISHAAFGWACGLVLGVVALRLTRFERNTQGLFYRPNLWLVLALTGLVLVRIVAGLVQGWRSTWHGVPWPVEGWLSHASLLGAAGVLLGYALAYATLLWRRWRSARLRGSVYWR
ncbi:CcdC protein domain-containing protein [Xanthomonas campestris]|uniref:CcdC protein domain-containing protein n=1 Tax=Xanthomonas campestris TaxID=339 RepID=UPI00094B7047|nr:CcdC protein domain-containing protein [Xanthomonas campestris]MCD0255948.1 DUF1453 family protein [Xanthomonas campestris pv. campestris]MDM7584534.1 DUF1453 family protein [Xanthomonas campestris]MDM7591653.1 DUF1453 family protein [Xanthomonas campestris]MEA9805745.1 CcdC protein domain-containing protein [Xanthomonas campestris pv. raphani]MEA9863588.1 CcdC protein domain-containing protein [Xanthomonas campestris pv. raphani]